MHTALLVDLPCTWGSLEMPTVPEALLILSTSTSTRERTSEEAGASTCVAGANDSVRG